MPDLPATPEATDLIEAKIRTIDADIARLQAERDRLAMALSILTGHSQSVNIEPMTPAQRRRIAKGARVKPSTAAFAKAISIPHAGGPGYSIRSLSEVLQAEGHSASRGTFTAVFDGLFKVSPKLAKRVCELTGYEFPASMIRDK